MKAPRHCPVWLALINMRWLPDALTLRILLADSLDNVRCERFRR